MTLIVYKKQFKHKIKNSNFNCLRNGFFGLRVLESCRLTYKQLEAIRRVFVRLTKRESKFWLMVYKNTRLTQKSKGSRMGKGTGAFYADAFNVKAGQLIFEFSHIEPKLLDNFLQDIKGKIPSKVEFVTRDSVYELNN